MVGSRINREPLRIPQEWQKQDRAFVIQLERILDDIYNRVGNGGGWSTIYPVGSIYMSVEDTSPEILFGGSWERLEDRFLVGASSDTDSPVFPAGDTGGSATHTLTTDEMPSHSHSFTGSEVTTGNNSVGHTHGLNGHKHSVGAHAHGLNGHVHSGPSHRHSLDTALKKNTNSLCGSGGTPTLYATTWLDNTGYAGTGNTGGNSGSTANSSSFDSGGNSGNTAGISANHTHKVTAAGTIGSTGSGAAFSTLPPYLAVYMWKRTA